MKKKHTTLKVKWSQKKRTEKKRRQNKEKTLANRTWRHSPSGLQGRWWAAKFAPSAPFWPWRWCSRTGEGGGRRRSPVAGRPLGRPRRRRSRARQTPRLRAVRRRVTGRVRTRPDPPDPVAPTAVRTSTECETKQNNNSSTGTERRDEGK